MNNVETIFLHKKNGRYIYIYYKYKNHQSHELHHIH